MKRNTIVLILITLQFSLFSQDLLRKYKTGSITLIADNEYASENDWNTIFRSYYDTLYGKPMGMRKSLLVLPDGSVIVNHAYKDYHTKFSPDGKFEKELVLEKATQKAIQGVLNGNILFTRPDKMGEMTCANLNGEFIKTLRLNYSCKDIVALNNGKIAVVGWVLWSEKIRSFISIVDYETNEEKIVWDHFTDRMCSSDGKKINNRPTFNYTVKHKPRGSMSLTTMPYSKSTGKGIPPRITALNNELIVAIPNTGEILTFDINGNQKSKSKINWLANKITITEQKEIQQKAINRYKKYVANGGEKVQRNLDAYNTMISEMEEDLENISSPLFKPYFSNIIKDSDGNVLFFEIPEEKNANVFHVWVYENGGQFVTKCSFLCEDYELNISASKMVFRDGYIYSLQVLKQSEENPLRLVRFKIKTE